MSLFSSLSPTHAPRADALAGLSYIQSLRGGAGGAMHNASAAAAAATSSTTAAWQAAAPAVAQTAAAAASPHRASSLSPSRVSLPQPSREQQQHMAASALTGSTLKRSHAGASSGSAAAAPSMLASPVHQFVFSAHSSSPQPAPPASSFGFGFEATAAAAHNADSLSGWSESDGAEQALRDSRTASTALSKPPSGSFTARPPSKPRAESSGSSTARLASSRSALQLEEKEASSARVSAIARAARLSQTAAAPKPAAAATSVAPFSPFVHPSPSVAPPRFQTAGSRTLEDEMLELENERRRRNKQRAAAEGESLQRSQQQPQEEKSTQLPKINGAEQQQPQRPDPLTSTGGAVAAAAEASSALLSGLPLPLLLPPNCSDGSSLALDWPSHRALFADEVASYTHRLTGHLQANLQKVLSKIQLNESAKLASTRHQIRDMMRFYHANEGAIYDVCVSNKDAERTLSLLELEAEELTKQTILIREDFDCQRAGLVGQLQALHSGQRMHHEYLLAHSKNQNQPELQKPRTRRPSKVNNSAAPAAPAADRSVSPGAGAGGKGEAAASSSEPAARSRGASRGESRGAGGGVGSRPRSRGLLSVDDAPSGSSSVPAVSTHDSAQVKIGVLRTYWQQQFVAVRLLREELQRVRAQVSNLDTELGHRVEEEQIKADALAGQLAQMQVNHEEQLAVRAAELTALQDEDARLSARHDALQAESDALRAAAASSVAQEEAAWRDIQASQSARTELARANDAVKAELENRFFEQQRVRLSAVQMSQEAFAWARARLLSAVSCPDCGQEQQASTVTWSTGESSCEACAFRKLFPPAFQTVVHTMHRAIKNQAAATAAASSPGQRKRQQLSGSFADDSNDGSAQSSPSLSRLQSSVLSGLGKEHFESASVTAARRLAQADAASAAAAAAAVVSESTGLGELGTRLLASMARSASHADDDDEDAEASAAAASVGDRIRRGSLGGIVDALTAMHQAAAATSKGDSSAPNSKPTPSPGDRGLAASGPASPALSASGSAVSLHSASVASSPSPLTLVWLRNRTVDLFLARLTAYRGSLDALSAQARAVQPLMDQFESTLSSAHQDRMEAERATRTTAQ